MGIFSLTPGGMIGDIVKNALTGPLIGGLVDSYKTKLQSGTQQDQMLADLAGRELQVELRERELATQQNLADEGRWWTAAPRAIVMWSVAIFVAKCIVWDKVLKLGSTDPLSGDLANVFGLVIAFWFAGRTVEKVSKIISSRFAR